MKITKLLMGTAAVLLSVSAAKAADAIVVEAEPMEYVKVCDMYGNGFFYIPGTETCMNINGYVRSTYEHSERKSTARRAGVPIGFLIGGLTDATTNTSNWTVRGRLNFDVRNETEYGTLRSELRLQGGDATAAGDQNVAIDRALISLAGFRLGYSDTYWTTNHGYGAGTPAINDGFYNYDQAIFFDYTATLAEGLSVTVGVQDSTGANASNPDFYAGLNWGSQWGTFAFTAIRDANAFESVGGAAYTPTDNSWAYKASAIIPLGESGWQVGGWYAWSSSNYNQYVSGAGGFMSGVATAGGLTPGVASLLAPTDREWGIQVNGALTDNVSVYGLYTHAEGGLSAAETPAGFVDVNSDVNGWAAGLIWAPVNQLTVQFEYAHTQGEINAVGTLDKISSETDAFLVRVTRSF